MREDSLFIKFHKIVTEEAEKPKLYDILLLSSWETKNGGDIYEERIEGIKDSIKSQVRHIREVYTLVDIDKDFQGNSETIIDASIEEAKKSDIIVVINFPDTSNISAIVEMVSAIREIENVGERIIYCQTDRFNIPETIFDTLKKKRIRMISFEDEESLKKKLNHAIRGKINKLEEISE